MITVYFYVSVHVHPPVSELYAPVGGQIPDLAFQKFIIGAGFPHAPGAIICMQNVHLSIPGLCAQALLLAASLHSKLDIEYPLIVPGV